VVKNLALLLVASLVAIAASEYLAGMALRHALATRGETVAARQLAASDGEPDVGDATAYDQSRARAGPIAHAVIHPYVGYVHLPSEGSVKSLVTGSAFDPPCPINRYGFLGQDDLLKNDPDAFNVLILGGSVANQFFCMARDTLAAELGKDPRLRGKRIHTLGLTVSGWRQPQQLLSVVYYLALGGQFNVAADLGGYNEAIDSIENVELLHVALDYPGDWPLLGPTLAEGSILRAARILTLRQRRRAAAQRFSRLRFSALAQLAWLAGDRSYERGIEALSLELKAELSRQGRYSFAEHGPRIRHEALKSEILRLWRETAVQLGHVAQANGGQFFEFLQPNQYVHDSKPLSPGERRCCVQADNARTVGLINEYFEAFAVQGEHLDPELVRFKDLRYVFANVPETVYIDTCCHLNEAGSRRLATAMAEEMRRHLGGS
jgi:hypothetical protein